MRLRSCEQNNSISDFYLLQLNNFEVFFELDLAKSSNLSKNGSAASFAQTDQCCDHWARSRTRRHWYWERPMPFGETRSVSSNLKNYHSRQPCHSDQKLSTIRMMRLTKVKISLSFPPFYSLELGLSKKENEVAEKVDDMAMRKSGNESVAEFASKLVQFLSASNWPHSL